MERPDTLLIEAVKILRRLAEAQTVGEKNAAQVLAKEYLKEEK